MNAAPYKALAGLLTLIVVSGCGDRSEKPPEPRSEGRAETRHIRNLEAIGYGGDGIADKLDSAIEAQEQRPRQLDEALEKQAD